MSEAHVGGRSDTFDADGPKMRPMLREQQKRRPLRSAANESERQSDKCLLLEPTEAIEAKVGNGHSIRVQSVDKVHHTQSVMYIRPVSTANQNLNGGEHQRRFRNRHDAGGNASEEYGEDLEHIMQ